MTRMREAELDALMARLASGERDAFDGLYEELRERASRLVTRRAPTSAVADVVQNAMLRVFARASEFTPGRPCLPWFYAIVSNEIRGASRRDARLTFVEEPPETRDDLDPERLFVERELERALELAIDALDVDSASALLALLGRAPMPAMAAPSFRKRVSRAYAKLRVLLGGHDAS